MTVRSVHEPFHVFSFLLRSFSFLMVFFGKMRIFKFWKLVEFVYVIIFLLYFVFFPPIRVQKECGADTRFMTAAEVGKLFPWIVTG